MLALLITTAFAQHVELEHADVLTAEMLPFDAMTVGHPSIHHADGRFVMVFEAEIVVDGCDAAYAVGRAESVDGLSWTVDTRHLQPTASNPCGVRRPASAFTDEGLVIAVEDVVTGAIEFRQRQGRRVERWTPTGLEGVSSISIARQDGVWAATAVDPIQGVVVFRSDDADVWTREDGYGLQPGTTWWSADGMLSPSLSCFDGASLPWVLHYGGRTGADTGLTYGLSPDLDTWYLSLAAHVWSDDSAWVAWDAVASPSATWMAFEVDGAISWGTTDASEPVGLSGRDCHTDL